MADGEKNSMVYDVDGTITGTPETMIIAKENLPALTPDCTFNEVWQGWICPKIDDFIGGRAGLLVRLWKI